VLAEPGGIGGVAAVPRQVGVEAEERHGGRCPVGWMLWLVFLCLGRGDI
jgi:hypothetical protein